MTVRSRLLRNAFAAATLAAFVSFNATQVSAATKVIAGEPSPAESLPVKTFLLFKDLAAKYSDGDLQVEVYPAGQLGTFLNMVTQVKTDLINIMFMQPDVLGAQAPAATANSWPFLFKNEDEALKAWKGAGGKALVGEVEKKSGYRMLAPAWNSRRWVYTTRDVKSLAELKGMKIRVPGVKIYVEQFKLLGMSPTPMDVGEIFTGLQQHVVEGVEGVISDMNSLSVQDVTKTVIMTDHVISPKIFVTHGTWLDSLSPKNRAAFERAADEAADFYGKTFQGQVDDLIAKFKAKGIRFISPELSVDEMRKMEEPLKADLPDVWKAAQTLAGQ